MSSTAPLSALFFPPTTQKKKKKETEVGSRSWISIAPHTRVCPRPWALIVLTSQKPSVQSSSTTYFHPLLGVWLQVLKASSDWGRSQPCKQASVAPPAPTAITVCKSLGAALDQFSEDCSLLSIAVAHWTNNEIIRGHWSWGSKPQLRADWGHFHYEDQGQATTVAAASVRPGSHSFVASQFAQKAPVSTSYIPHQPLLLL